MKIFILLFIACVQCDIISEINKSKQSWEAKETITNISFREDVLSERQPLLNVSTTVNKQNTTLPEQFDWRKGFKQCTHEVLDGGSCANSWAITPAMVMNYRACQQGKLNRYSSVRILACCQECGAGCYGGYPWLAFHFIKNEGVPSNSCQPLPSLNAPIRALTPFCKLKICDDKSEYKTYKINNVYKVKDIRYEIYKHGPVISHMTLFKDFYYYKKGIYKHITGPKVGRLNVILLGWGEENGVKFWIGENTWGREWGENGYFRIIRGANHANVEQYVITAII